MNDRAAIPPEAAGGYDESYKQTAADSDGQGSILMTTPTVELEHCAEALRALGDPIRLQIIQHLRRGPSNVGDLATAIDSTTVNVSHHLGILYHAKFVARSKRGRFVVYSLPKTVLIKTARGVEQIDLQCCKLELPQFSE